jgi:GntR family transcriptional regulator
MELAIHLSTTSGVPLYRQIVAQASEQIRSGRLPAGARLPSFRSLAARHGVSGVTVRRAYLDLERAGLLAAEQGRGTFVASGVTAVGEATALEDARATLAEAIARAQGLGLDVQDLHAILGALVGSPDGNPGWNRTATRATPSP